MPIPAFLTVIIVLAHLRIEAVWNPPMALPALNIVFTTLVSFLISVLAARSFLSGKASPILFLGSGTLGMGAALAVSPLVGPGSNANVATYDTAACLAGFCHLVSAIADISAGPRRARSNPRLLLASYLGIIFLVAALVLLVRSHLWPVYFTEGSGDTAYGFAVGWTTAGLFALAAVLMGIASGKSRSDFLRWYALGLGLIAVGLVGVSLQTSIGDPLNWAGWMSQYLGGVYMLIAVISSVGQSGDWVLPLEKALRESEDRYQRLVDMSPDAILVHAGGEYVFANPAAARLFGARSPKDVVGKDVMELIHPVYHAAVAQRIEHAYGSEVTTPREVRFVRLDGSPVDVEVLGARVEFGGNPAVLIVVRDITERKEAEAERERLLASEREARALAEEAVKVRDEFISIAAHELKTPVTSLQGFAQLTQRELAKTGTVDPGHLSRAMERIEQQSKRLTKLSDQLLSLSRLQSGKLELSTEETKCS